MLTTRKKPLSLITSSMIIVTSVLTVLLVPTHINAFGNNNNNMSNMMSVMMEQPQDVIIKLLSNPIVPVAKESEIKLLVLDKETQKPLTGAQVVVGTERGAAMTTMEMVGPMLKAEEQIKGSGVYVIKFIPDSKGIYTLHTHVIPSGEPMSSMMTNHLEIGIVAEDKL